MSGFIALISDDHSPVDNHLLEQLTQYLEYRGPDAQTSWIDGHVGLGHALFRTTFEAEYENQPASLDNIVWIICSARIDGRQDLLTHLGLSTNCELNTTPDSELILHAYRKWGEHCLDYLIGDFAFVIWDKGLQKLFCARDRFGMRHLYYARVKNFLILGNSLQCMLKHPGVSKKLNDQAIGDFLLFGDHTWFDKTQSAFADVMSLPPAHSLVIESGSTKIRRYWDVPNDIPLLKYRKQEDYIEHFYEAFTTAVEDRMRSSKIVVSLSGGLDSPSIGAVAMSLQEKNGTVRKISGVSVVYSSVHPCDEKEFIEKVAQHLSIPVTYIEGAKYRFLQPYRIDTTRPCEAYTPLLHRDFSEAAAQLGNVMLTGAAGDNLLSYWTPLKSKSSTNWFRLIGEVVRLRFRYGVWPPLGTGMRSPFQKYKTSKNHEEQENYPEYLNEIFAKHTNLSQRLQKYIDLQTIENDLNKLTIRSSLTEPDWNTDDCYTNMGFTRPEECDPFLDTRLVLTVLSLPPLPWLFNKHILRQTMLSRLPQQVIKRPKTPLGNIHESLLKHLQDDISGKLKLDERLGEYVDLKKLHEWSKFTNGCSIPYENLRPFLLQAWLTSVDQW